MTIAINVDIKFSSDQRHDVNDTSWCFLVELVHPKLIYLTFRVSC